MPGPYFEGQTTSSPCDCYFPDVAMVRNDPERGKRILQCINHGEFAVDPPEGTVLSTKEFIPIEEWREAERRRLRGKQTVG